MCEYIVVYVSNIRKVNSKYLLWGNNGNRKIYTAKFLKFVVKIFNLHY